MLSAFLCKSKVCNTKCNTKIKNPRFFKGLSIARGGFEPSTLRV
jgi:hypothetical protein